MSCAVALGRGGVAEGLIASNKRKKGALGRRPMWWWIKLSPWQFPKQHRLVATPKRHPDFIDVCRLETPILHVFIYPSNPRESSIARRVSAAQLPVVVSHFNLSLASASAARASNGGYGAPSVGAHPCCEFSPLGFIHGAHLSCQTVFLRHEGTSDSL